MTFKKGDVVIPQKFDSSYPVGYSCLMDKYVGKPFTLNERSALDTGWNINGYIWPDEHLTSAENLVIDNYQIY